MPSLPPGRWTRAFLLVGVIAVIGIAVGVGLALTGGSGRSPRILAQRQAPTSTTATAPGQTTVTTTTTSTTAPAPSQTIPAGQNEPVPTVGKNGIVDGRKDPLANVAQDKLPDVGVSNTPISWPLHTAGAQIVNSSGQRVVLHGVNWFGFETSDEIPHGLWTRDYRSMLKQIKQLGFNVIRMPFSEQMVKSKVPPTNISYNNGMNAPLKGKTPLEDMQLIIQAAGADGIAVILDNHSTGDNDYEEPLWYDQQYSYQDWLNMWAKMSTTFASDANVIGADLKNEPHGQATWGGGGPDDWRLAAERAGAIVQAHAPHWLILVEGIEQTDPGDTLTTSWWGGNLENAGSLPVSLPVADHLVYSAHEYGPGVFDQPWFQGTNQEKILPRRWEAGFGYLVSENVAPVLIGEFGGYSTSEHSREGLWQRQFIDYLSRRGISWTYWSLNPDSGDTGGVLNNDWTTVNQSKMQLLSLALQGKAVPYQVAKIPTAIQDSGSGQQAQPAQPTQTQPTQTQPVTPPATPAPSVPTTNPSHAQPPTALKSVNPDKLQLSLATQSHWSGGWCVQVVVKGPTSSLSGEELSLDLPTGSALTSGWNGAFSGKHGVVKITLPTWTAIGSSPYEDTGACGTGTVPTTVTAGR